MDGDAVRGPTAACRGAASPLLLPPLCKGDAAEAAAFEVPALRSWRHCGVEAASRRGDGGVRVANGVRDVENGV